MNNIAIFASGSGTNAENLIRFFSNEKIARVAMVLSNNPEAFVLERAKRLSVETYVFDRDEFYTSGKVLKVLADNSIDFIVLAGFLWLVPMDFIQAYNDRIINIHPALLPKYGGKGMYGERVHRAVIENGEKVSGITIHYVNKIYDAGDIIFQARCQIAEGETADTLAAKVHELEYKYFPEVVKKIIRELNNK
ncbi:MAG TPA: phosphoribosylglycinamide formyltransferase [Bacteroidales bacterium]|nr:phosphoribosylglycinamide formyltransferase [Bacteroidales bacterium]